MQKTIHALIRPGEQSGFVAECPGLNAVTQGADVDETVANLREVVGLALDGATLSDLGLSDHPIIVISIEVEPAVA